MNIGLIKWFDDEKGFGVISAINNAVEVVQNENVTSTKSSNEVFLHIKNWKDSVSIDSSKIIPVVFETTFERNKITGKKCKYFTNTKKNWLFLFSHLGENETIRITDRHSNREYNLISYSLKALTNDFKDNILSESSENCLKLIPIEQIIEKTLTLLNIRKETENLRLVSTLDNVIFKYFHEIETGSKLDLWRKQLIPISCISNNEFLKYSESINIDDLKSIKEQKKNEELTNLLIIQLLKELAENFDYNTFNSFMDIVAIVDSEDFRGKIINDINAIAKSNLVKSFFNELESIGKIEDNWELEQIEKKRNEIPDFINSELEKEIKKAIEYYILENASINGLLESCLIGYISEPETIILKNQNELTESSFTKIIDSKEIFTESFVDELLENLSSNISKHELVLDVAAKLNNETLFDNLDKQIYEQIDEKDYFTYWSKGKGKIIPEKYLLSHFNEDEERYKQIEDWIDYGYITSDEINKLFENKLKTSVSIEDRKEFHTVFNIVSYLINKEPNYIEALSNKKNPFQLLIIWYLGHIQEFDYDILKGKFIYFKPFQQVRIVKKLFCLKKEGAFNLTIEKLDNLVRADIDLFLTNEKFNPDIILDLSTSIVIESIKKFKSVGKFLVESELLSIVLKEIGLDKTKKFQLSEYFDKCEGRMVGEYNWKRYGEIKKQTFGNNQFYFIIEFEYDAGIVEAVRKLPGRKYNNEEKHWGVPSKYEAEVLAFAKEQRFFLNFEGSNYANNIHLIDYKRDDIPNGIKFCEGQKAQNEHNTNKRTFWWCSNQPCFENVENLHTSNEWENYTILDFLNILGLSVIEQGKFGNFDIGLYNQFVSHINRFNQLLDRIYCRECKQILYPVESSNYAAYSVVRFCCENKECKEHKNVIYLNHCLNGKCNSIIDSRDSKKCTHGLYICQTCGSCCSHAMFTRRLSNLENTGGVIHDDLRLKIENKEGHLERAEYYCHSCGNMMNETETDTFKCFDCNVTYETDKYRFDREYRSLRRKDYPTGNINVEFDEPDDDIF